MIYQSSSGLYPSTARKFFPTDCPDESYRLHLFGRAVQYLFSGLVIALLMPIEVLRYLWHGGRGHRRAWISWALSAVVWTSGIALWLLERAMLFDGHERSGAILAYGFILVGAAFMNGRLQVRKLSYAYALARNGQRNRVWLDPLLYSHSHHGHSHHGHRGSHGHHGHPHGRPAPFRFPATPGFPATPVSETIAPEQNLTASGVCIGNCRECTEAVCVKTGRQKRRNVK